MKPSQLQPGDKYLFRIIREVFPDEQEKYWVLESPFKTRHLLVKSMYPDCNFKPGENILCRIDKINCSGKIFLEPENPFYKEGGYYDFVFDHTELITNTIGEKQLVAVMTGIHRERGVLPQAADIQSLRNGDKVNAAVLRIKKGILILSENLERQFKYLQFYKFRIAGEGINHKNNNVFILEDDKGRKCSVQKDNYKYYGLKTGDILNCKITGFNIDGSCIPEPEHPYLKAGRVYKFRWVRQEIMQKSGKEHHDIHIVRDYKGNEQAVAPVDDELLKAFKNKESLYKILRFHKGKLVLIPRL
jgi:hypothetical protein